MDLDSFFRNLRRSTAQVGGLLIILQTALPICPRLFAEQSESKRPENIGSLLTHAPEADDLFVPYVFNNFRGVSGSRKALLAIAEARENQINERLTALAALSVLQMVDPRETSDKRLLEIIIRSAGETVFFDQLNLISNALMVLASPVEKRLWNT